MLRTLTILTATAGLSDGMKFSWEDCGTSEGAHVKFLDMKITPESPKIGDKITITSTQASSAQQ